MSDCLRRESEAVAVIVGVFVGWVEREILTPILTRASSNIPCYDLAKAHRAKPNVFETLDNYAANHDYTNANTDGE